MHRHWRFSRSGLVMEALLPAIIEQKVTGQEAFGGFRALVQRYGERAPGPGHDLDLWVQPHPEELRGIPSWEWLKLHIDPARSRAVVMAARVADSLQRIAALDGEEADQRLRSLPGIGVWTSAEVRQRALGDADAVSFGDYHVAKDIGWALTGEQLDDLAAGRAARALAAAARPGAGAGRPGRSPAPAAGSADGAAGAPAEPASTDSCYSSQQVTCAPCPSTLPSCAPPTSTRRRGSSPRWTPRSWSAPWPGPLTRTCSS